MEGMNWKFLRDTSKFLREHAILEAPRHAAGPPAQGIVEFDLEPIGAGPAVRIGDFANRGKVAGRTASRISAYWLPWQPRGVSQIQLGDRADYFFTSQLAGCQIRIVPSMPRYVGTNHPLIMHIAGDMKPRDSATNAIAWRNLQARLHLSAAQFQISRALSSSKIGQYGYDGEMVNVVGFIRRFQWQFWAQQVDGEHRTVTRVWQL